ncbi:beta-glucuronosyltransferase GlcAT14B [Cucumis melo var. makuwa]|uniref:Beta-glucuronosyltransferase GlcAT14B n=1 Tax=Cucumis melo var. makuwa TaxID=1194695 RepID=A0A5D3D2N8_CUCMM|nr:beta-glucuronosyltransferase GlcAT14B [Cucumis melo var. makuwa]TYK18182.1 beta-glucuronosyltransferase GlcAT14B [Cucumis melo var. makuwa]
MIGRKVNVGGFLNPPWMRKNMNSHSGRIDEPLPLDAVSFAKEEDSNEFFIEPELRSSLKETSGVVKMEPLRLAYLILGPTMIACTLQAISVLLRESLDWDWFINLSASDYPLMTQDDLFHVFSNITRNFNFIEHSQIAGWKLSHRAKLIIIDPGLYLSKNSELA